MKITIEVPDQFVSDLEEVLGSQPQLMPGPGGGMTEVETLPLEERLKARYENEIDQQIISRRTQDANEAARQEVVDARAVINETTSSSTTATKAPVISTTSTTSTASKTDSSDALN